MSRVLARLVWVLGRGTTMSEDVVGTLEQIAATNDDLNIAKRNIFAVYKKK